MIIIGAGLSGLIAGSMLRGSSIFDHAPGLPNNHSALLRFRSSVVGDAVGVPFRRVDVMKSVQPWRNPVADAISYSLKSTGHASLRSILSVSGEVDARYIAPNDLIQRLARQISPEDFRWNADAERVIRDRKGLPIISTIPMPALMDILDYPELRPRFNYVSGATITYDLPEEFDVCATVYFPDPEIPCYRASITERRLIIEFSNETESFMELNLPENREQLLSMSNAAIYFLGIQDKVDILDFRARAKFKPMKYAKITRADEQMRKRFILWATEAHNIYSLGRFATWRPGLLLDDVVNDVRVIQSIAGGDNSPKYEARK